MGKKALTKTQINRIISLRKRGYSIPEIRRITFHGSGTTIKYIKGVKILPEYRELWENKRKPSVLRKIQEEQRAQNQAKQILGKISKKEKALIAACLYWAEGSKRDFSLSNTDPRLIQVFVECLTDFGITKESLKVTVRLYEDLNIRSAITFWSRAVGIPQDKILNVNILKGKKSGKLPYGMCRIRVTKGGYLLKLIQGLINLMSAQLISPRSSTDRASHS